MKLSKLLVLLSALAFITGCATESYLQAKNINITKKSISRLCQWRGKVSVTDETQKSQTNDVLKLQAAKLGANTIVLSSASKGEAFWCP